jgi:hypothetical protein
VVDGSRRRDEPSFGLERLRPEAAPPFAPERLRPDEAFEPLREVEAFLTLPVRSRLGFCPVDRERLVAPAVLAFLLLALG